MAENRDLVVGVVIDLYGRDSADILIGEHVFILSAAPSAVRPPTLTEPTNDNWILPSGPTRCLPESSECPHTVIVIESPGPIV